MANIPVKWARSDMRGAPVINGVAGSLIAALRTFLITGFAPTAAVSATALDGIATIMLPSAQSFEEHAVVLLAGATTPGFNGEERVITTASDRITVATSAPNGPIAGSITVRYAPVGGWEEVFSKTNVSVFRSAELTGSRMYLRVDDTGTIAARVRAYESMADVDAGTGPFPTDAQMSGGGYWHKSSVASTAAARWKLFGDSKRFLLAVASNSAASASNTVANLRGFGDPLALSPAGDAFACFVSVTGSGVGNSSNGALEAVQASTGVGMTVCARSITGLGSAVLCSQRPFTGDTSHSGASSYMGAAPSAVDGQIKFSRMFSSESGTQSPARFVVPGVLYVPQSGLLSLFSDGDIVPLAGDLAGRRSIVIPTGTTSGAAPTGAYLVDVSGPW